MIAKLLFAGLALAVAANVGSLAYKLWSVRRDMAAAWAEHRADHGEDVGEPAFKRAYFRAYGPRGALYGFIGLALAAAVTPLAFIILGQAWDVGWRLSGEPSFYAAGTLIWQFYLFFGLIGCWVAIAALVAQRFHSRRVRDFRHELALARERA